MNDIIDLKPHSWMLLVGPHSVSSTILTSLVHLAHRRPLTVLDCGHQFDSTVVARIARGRVELVDRIQIQRAFMCEDATNLLKRTPTGSGPILILDFLNSFYDENVQIKRRRFLLEQCIQQLGRLSRGPGLAVSVHPPYDSSDAVPLFKRLYSASPKVLDYEAPAPAGQQLILF